MGPFTGGYRLDSIYAQFIVDDLHLFGLLDLDRPRGQPEKDAVLDDDLAGPLNSDTVWWEVAKG